MEAEPIILGSVVLKPLLWSGLISALTGTCWLVLMPERDEGRNLIGVFIPPVPTMAGFVTEPGVIPIGFNFPLVLARPALA